jgi:DNA invertase Pin-like site-specific DNA recombinase
VDGRAFGKFSRELGLNAEPVLIEMMAVIAAQERRMISRRTKAALAAAKAWGVKFGSYRHAEAGDLLGRLRIPKNR